jgi:hypothetical protein
MTLRELIAKVRDKLQDADAVYWSDSEFIDLYNEGKRYLASERKENPTTTSVSLSDGVYEYNIDGVLRYISAKDNDKINRELYPDDGNGDNDADGIIIMDYDTIYVNTPVTGTTITLKHIAFPADDNLNDPIRSGDEESYTYFLLSKAYEKDTDMEQFQKAQYFWSMFTGAMKFIKKNSSLNYIDKTQTVKGYYY